MQIVRHANCLPSLRGGGTRGIMLRNNDLEAARRRVEFETPALKKALVADM